MWGTATEDELESAEQQDEVETWRALMASHGYTEGPWFSSYDELSDWERENNRPQIRRPTSFGFEFNFQRQVGVIPGYHTHLEPFFKTLQD